MSNMKAFFSIILAMAVAVGTAEAGPAKRAAYVAKTTAKTAKNVAHSVVKGTRRAGHAVVEAVTPEVGGNPSRTRRYVLWDVARNYRRRRCAKPRVSGKS